MTDAIELAGRVAAVSGMKQDAARGIRKLADQVAVDHPLTHAHEHLRDADAALGRGGGAATQSAARHLDAARRTMSGQQMMRHGVFTDEEHATAAANMGAVTRHQLKVRDIQDIEAQNNDIISAAREKAAEEAQKKADAKAIATGQFAPPNPDLQQGPKPENAGSGMPPPLDAPAQPGTLAEHNTAQKTAAAAKLRTGTGPASGKPPGTPKPVAMSTPLDFVGPKGYEHGWKFVGNAQHPSAPGKVKPFAYEGAPGGFGHINAMMAYANDLQPGGELSVPEAFNNMTAVAQTAIRNAARSLGQRDMKGVAAHLQMAAKFLPISQRASFRALAASMKNVPRGVGQEPSLPELPAAFSEGQAYQDLQIARDTGGRITKFSTETARLEATPAPRGKPGGPGLYDVKGLGHSAYFQQVVKALIEKRGMPPARAYAVAYGALRKWRAGGGHVHPEVQAAATGSLAEEAAKGAAARAAHGHSNTADAVELVGPKGYVHNWHYVGGPGLPSPAAHSYHGHGHPMAAAGATPVHRTKGLDLKGNAPESTAGRREALKQGHALPPSKPGGRPGFPITDPKHWDKAMEAVGRSGGGARRLALAKLLARTAPEFGKSIKGTWIEHDLAGVSMSSTGQTEILLFNPAGNPSQARVASGAGGGQFTKSGGSGQKAGKKPAAPRNKAQAKAALLSKAKADYAHAAKLRGQISLLVAAIHKATTSSSPRTSKSTTVPGGTTTASTAAAATKATAAASSTAAGSTAPKSQAAVARSQNLTQMYARLHQLRQQLHTTLAQAATARAQAAKL